jgi:hypothetical protein
VYNVKFKKGSEDWIMVSGEIHNETSRDYKDAIFRLVLFDKTQTMGFGLIKVFNFNRGITRYFEIIIDGISYLRIPQIVRYELILESGH